MGRLIATVFFVFLILLLYWLNRESREGEIRTSKALWLPTFWLFIGSSRSLTEWFHLGSAGRSVTYMEGSPLDRAVLTAVLALGVAVLLKRASRAGVLLRSNLPILLYFAYCLLSVVWSDFPDVALKRWFRALGDVVMVLVVLTHPDWIAEIKRLFGRLGCLLIPLSILFSRWYPQYGRQFSRGGHLYWSGVTPEKNTLGALCLVFGLAFLYLFLESYRERKSVGRGRRLIARGLVVIMAMYLLIGSDSATALASFLLAAVPMVLTFRFKALRKPVWVHAMVLGALGFAVCALFLNIGSGVLDTMGRNATLTGRTAIWHDALTLAQRQNPLLGTGFQSFWLGTRYRQMKALTGMDLNQVHNGYLEIFVNLGWIGVALVALVLITAYRRVVKAVRWISPMASLRLAFFMIAITQNFTEASFGLGGGVWMGFLMTTMVMPEVPRTGEWAPQSLRSAQNLVEAEEELAGVAAPVRKQVAYDIRRRDFLRTR